MKKGGVLKGPKINDIIYELLLIECKEIVVVMAMSNEVNDVRDITYYYSCYKYCSVAVLCQNNVDQSQSSYSCCCYCNFVACGFITVHSVQA